jgi:hypothetical protein
MSSQCKRPEIGSIRTEYPILHMFLDASSTHSVFNEMPEFRLPLV